MSADNESLFYCLSEDGWSLIEEDNPPNGWVRIYEVRIYQGSQFGRESRHWQGPRTNPAWTEEAADQLEKTFPRPERSRELSPEALKGLGITNR
jgi:hypothetical protein